MSDRPISFRVCDFSEQLCRDEERYGHNHITYSAVMHVDGEVYQWRRALNGEFMPPIAALRTEGWLELLRMVAEKKAH